jgi:hypothetical protein
MGCCGDKRKAAVSRLGNVVLFEYLGRTGLTVTGPISRRTYRFPLQGARVAVDARDAATLAAVPTLRRIPPGDASPHGVESAAG